MPRFTIWPALAGLSLLGCGPSRIIGRVIDQDGAVVADADVTTEPMTNYVKTAPGGIFVIESQVTSESILPLPTGKYAVMVRKLGCEQEAVVSIDVGRGSEVRTGDIKIKCRRIEIESEAPDTTKDSATGDSINDQPITGE